MNTINKLDLLKASYNKQKIERNIQDYEVKVDSVNTIEDLPVMSIPVSNIVKQGDKVITTQDTNYVDDDYEFNDFLLSRSMITNTFTRVNNLNELKDRVNSERIYQELSDSIKSVNVSDTLSTEDILKSLEDVFVKFIDEYSDKINNSQCVKIISLLISRFEDLNKLKYPLCSLIKTEEFVNENLDVSDTDKLVDFLDQFLKTYMDEEMQSYDNNKMVYYRLGKFEDFKKFQMSKIDKINMVLEWLLRN